MQKYIRLPFESVRASTFHSSKLIKILLERKKLFAFSYYEARIKSSGFSSRKQNDGNLT